MHMCVIFFGEVTTKGQLKYYVMEWGWGWGGAGGLRFSGKKHYEGVRFNVISVTRGWVGVKYPGKSVT